MGEMKALLVIAFFAILISWFLFMPPIAENEKAVHHAMGLLHGAQIEYLSRARERRDDQLY
jgi:hypothetical protein